MTASSWTDGLPKLVISGIRAAYGDLITVELSASQAGSVPLVTVAVDRSDLSDPCLEIGAAWSLSPGPRQPTYRERLAEAEAALAAAGGDESALTDEQRALLLYVRQPF